MNFSHPFYGQNQPSYQFIGIPPLTPSHSNSAASEEFNNQSPPVRTSLPAPNPLWLHRYTSHECVLTSEPCDPAGDLRWIPEPRPVPTELRSICTVQSATSAKLPSRAADPTDDTFFTRPRLIEYSQPEQRSTASGYPASGKVRSWQQWFQLGRRGHDACPVPTQGAESGGVCFAIRCFGILSVSRPSMLTCL